MNVVFLSPHFPPNWFNFCVRLREAGATVLGLADAPYEELRPELREALTEYYRVSDLHNYGELVRALGYFTHRYGKIERLDSLNEYWLEIEAGLRTDFNIPGLGRREIGQVRRKSLMKRTFERAGLPVPRGRVCRSGTALRELIAEVGFPVVAKPDSGVGAARTYKIEDEQDVERFLRERPPVPYMVEECLTGTLLTYDGLVNDHGEVAFESSFFYSTGVMESVNLGVDIYYCITRELPADVAQMGRHIARAFRLRGRPFHFEFFRLPDARLVPLEVNMRPPGGLTVDMFNYANQIDFYRAWAEVTVYGSTELQTERPYYCCYASRKRWRHYRRSHEQVLGELGPLIVHHAPMDSAFSVAIGDHGYILRHPQIEPVLEAAAAIHELADDG
jgi:hypothetical protein